MLAVSRKLPTELSLIGPCVAVWSVVFYICVYKSATNDWSESPWHHFLALTSGVGLYMSCMWLALYGQLTLRRVLVGLLVVTCVGYTAGLVRHAFLSTDVEPAPISDPALLSVFILMTGMIPFWLMRRLLGWQILRSGELPSDSGHRYSVRNVFAWTAFVAVVLALLSATMSYDNHSIFSIILIWAVIPGILGGAILAFAARFNTIGLLSVGFLVSLFLAVCALVLSTANSSVFDSNTARNVFEIWGHCAAGTMMWLTAMIYLKRRGVVFHCFVDRNSDSLTRDGDVAARR